MWCHQQLSGPGAPLPSSNLGQAPAEETALFGSQMGVAQGLEAVVTRLPSTCQPTPIRWLSSSRGREPQLPSDSPRGKQHCQQEGLQQTS